MAKPSSTQHTLTLQGFFISAVLILYSIELVTLLGQILQQYPSNPNLSGHVPMILYALTPPLFLLTIWLARRRSDMTVRVLFESLLLTVAANAVFLAASTLLWQLPLMPNMGDNVLAAQLWSWAVPLLISWAVLLVVLSRLRAARQW